jgi:hypothetical protein
VSTGKGRRRVALSALLVLALGVVACGDETQQRADVISAGQVDIKLPPGWKVTAQGVERPAPAGPAAGGGSSAAGAAADTATGETVPLAKEDPTTAFFSATSKFQACLKNSGTKFIGAPDAKNPSSPANDPNYVKALSTCAAHSNIVQALKDQSAAQAAQTPEQIQKSNEGFLAWRDCMIAKGWDIPKPTPDSQGRLFNLGGGGGAGVQIKAPPGKDLMTSSDTRDCATEAQTKTGAGG